MAWRESRRARGRLILHVAAVSLGVGAVVAINSFGANVNRAVIHQARALLGADLELQAPEPLDSLAAMLDSARRAGAAVSRVTSFGSMVLALRTGRTRLVEIRAIEGQFPYYATITTAPPGLWPTLQTSRCALVDSAVLITLGARVGDTVAVGEARFPIAGAVTDAPGDVGLRTALGPRVFLPARYLASTELLGFGSRARYRVYLKFASDLEGQRFLATHRAALDAAGIGHRTVRDEEEDLNRALGTLARYLGLVALVALLLGALGVASAVRVFVRSKLSTAALLRCLGATERSVFAIYLAQAIAVGLIGASGGALLGVAAQTVLPAVARAFLPLEVTPALDGRVVLSGLALGVLTAVVSAFVPLLALRTATPLQALRRDQTGPTPGLRAGRLAAFAAVAGGVVVLSLWEAPRPGVGLGFAGGVGGAALLLWLTAVGLMNGLRRFLPATAPYVVRQGLANLFRPENQTVAVILSLGFGVCLLGTIYVVQRNLVAQFAPDTGPGRANLVLFDIEPDQRSDVVDFLSGHGVAPAGFIPVVPARITGVNGQPIAALRDSSRRGSFSRAALVREYRNTYRDSLVGGEEITAGQWWGPTGGLTRQGLGSSREPSEPMARISVDEDLAKALGLSVGSHVTWDVQGVTLESEVTSLRRVSWGRFQPNFFVVFEPGTLEDAPQTYASLVRVAAPSLRATLQRDLVVRFPNITCLDIALVEQSLDSVLTKVSTAIRFMALFSLASGVTILIGGLATSRLQRERETLLLRMLGASDVQIRSIVFMEYILWGSLAGAVGLLLAGAAGWGVVRFVLEMPFTLPWKALAAAGLGVAGLTTAVGWASSGDLLRKSPLAAWRALIE